MKNFSALLLFTCFVALLNFQNLFAQSSNAIQGIFKGTTAPPPCNATSGVPVAPLTEFDQCGQDAGDLLIQSFTEQPGGTTDFALIVTYPNETFSSTWDAPIQGISEDGTFDFCGLPLGQYCFHSFSYNQAELDIITNNALIQSILPCLAGGEPLEEVLACTNLIFGFSSIDAAVDSVLNVLVPVLIPEFIPPNEPPCYSVIPEGMEYCIDLTCSDFTSPCFSTDQIIGCTDNSACNFNPIATVDDGSCLANDCEGICGGSTTPGTACTDANGNMGIYDADCICDAGGGIPGCTDPTACNYDPNASIDDGGCAFNDCEGECGGTALPGSVCTNADGNQSTYQADCSCPVCEEEINGAIVVSDPECDVSGINITIIAPDGTSITVTTDAAGNFTVPGGPFPCGTYTAAFEDTANVPSCYSETGSIEPILFDLDGEESDVDVAFFGNPTIPTLSQWGLIVLALLLMNFGAISLLGQRLRKSYIF